MRERVRIVVVEVSRLGSWKAGQKFLYLLLGPQKMVKKDNRQNMR